MNEQDWKDHFFKKNKTEEEKQNDTSAYLNLLGINSTHNH